MITSFFTWKKVRKLFNDIHLWLGIGAGLILFVVCLTGTIYTFKSEIEEWLEPERYFVTVPDLAQAIDADKLVDRIETELAVGEVSALTIPANPKRAYILTIRKEGERRGSNYYVNPYTGAIIGDGQGKATAFFRVIFRLHRWLLLDTKIGRPITGWATVIFVLLVLTGLVIWFPQRIKAWKQGLKIKWKANWKRLNHDLHNALGFYAAFFLLIMGLTGLFWSFDWYRSGLYAMLGVEGRSEPRREKAAPKPAVLSDEATKSLGELLQIAHQELDYKGNCRINLPEGNKTEIAIRKNKVGFFAPAGADEITLHLTTGAILHKEIFTEKPFKQKIARSIRSLHVGDIFGTFSKILYFLSCLIATSLPVTGTIIWVNKLKKKAKRKVAAC